MYLFVPIQWVDDELHHAVYFSLESELFWFLSQLFHLSYIQSIQLDGFFFTLYHLII